MALEKKIHEADAGVRVFGHPRGKGKSAWTPIDLRSIEGEPKTATKGAFIVRLGGAVTGRVVLQVGPEPRPFPELRALDVDLAAAEVLAALRGSKGASTD